MAKSKNTAATGKWRQRMTRALSGVADREHLLELLREASGRGVLEPEALAMLEGALAITELQVRDIMVPRPEMVCIRRDDALAQIISAVVAAGHSRYPVLDGDRDDVAGILLAKDLLRAVSAERSAGGSSVRFDMREYLRPAVFVPESKRLNVLLREFRSNRNHMALVVDEYGGIAGLVTIENVIEQIVGDIDDEFDVEDDQNIRADGPQHYWVRGATRLDEFNEQFGCNLADNEVETVAGLVMKQMGRVPRRGEALQYGGFEFRVLRSDRRRVDALRVNRGAAGLAVIAVVDAAS